MHRTSNTKKRSLPLPADSAPRQGLPEGLMCQPQATSPQGCFPLGDADHIRILATLLEHPNSI